jgi:hypothetical protein
VGSVFCAAGAWYCCCDSGRVVVFPSVLCIFGCVNFVFVHCVGFVVVVPTVLSLCLYLSWHNWHFLC